MKKTLHALAFSLIVVISTGCGNTLRYASRDIDARTIGHQQVAIVPPVISYTGPIPGDLSKEDQIAIDVGESRMYQNSLYNFLLRKSYKNVRVDMQPIEKTNSLLRDAGINTHESWRMQPQELAEVLGVDAVIRLQVDESRYMSDMAGLGIDAGRAVINSIFFGPSVYPFPVPVTRTADIRSSCSIFDARDGSLIWKMGVIRSTNWSRLPEMVVDDVNRKFARNFPYR
jgi:hypothetical protein